MGQQQLLLIILGVIVVGIAVAVGITMFQDNATSSNRDAVTNDLINLASQAQQFYRRTQTLGGGGNSFVGLSNDASGLAKLTSKPSNANGTYAIATAGTSASVVLQGVGVEKGNDGTALRVQMTVYPDSTVVDQQN